MAFCKNYMRREESIGMKGVVKRIFSMIIVESVLLTICTGCAMDRKSPFFSMIETKHEKQDANAVLENFSEYVQNEDFTKFDYAYNQGKHIYQAECVTEIDAYRNEKNMVFCADTKDAEYYYNQKEGVLHCEIKSNVETNDLDGKQMKWSDFPFDTTMEKAYQMLSYLCEAKDYLYLEYEYKSLADWGCKNLLTLFYRECSNEGTEEWDNRTSEWKEQFGESTPYYVSVFCNDDGTKFNCISMVWYEENIRYTVTWNSYDAILQSERCVIRYEYDHGLRTDNVPALEEQRERLKNEMGNNLIYE